jgi:hypothetical protein
MSDHIDQRWGRPVAVRGRLDDQISRWLWLVKWLLLIPHYVVLFFLWVAFGLVTIAAFFAILVTGRYPHSLFAFNLGVLRWTWRVSYYGYSALGTDRYPPFSLGAEPDYPATLDIAYPGRLSRGLVLVKWWLLAIPQYLVLGLIVGGSATATTTTTGNGNTWTTVTTAGSGLLPLLVLFAGVALLFTARYPVGLFAFVLGLNRWVMRVIAYASLMTDTYPPFRLDQGGDEVAPPPSGPLPGSSGGAALAPPVPPPAVSPAPAPQTRQGGSSAGSIVALVAGVLVLLVGLGLGAGGGAALWLTSRRDTAGFVATPGRTLTTTTAALTVEGVDIDLGSGVDAWVPSDRFGTVRVRAQSIDGSPVFIGIAPQSAIDGWLGGVAHDQVRDVGRTVTYVRDDGTATAVTPPPTAQTFWAASVSGSGRQELTWKISSGQWGVVLARPDGAPGISARVDLGANIPDITGLGTGLLVAGGVLFLGGAALIVLGAVGLGRRSTPPAAPPRVPAQGPPVPRPGEPQPEEEGRPVGKS